MRDPILLGAGMEPSVAVTPDTVLVAIAPGSLVTLNRAGTVQFTETFPSFLFPALSPDGRYLLVQSQADAGAPCVLHDLAAGGTLNLGPSYGLIAVDASYGAFQRTNDQRIMRVRWADLAIQGTDGVGCPRGLVYVRADGTVATWDDAHYRPEWPGFLDPRPIADLVYGTGVNGGITMQRAGGRICILAAGTYCNDPQIAFCDGLYAVVAWGNQSGGVRLWLLTAEDIDGLPLLADVPPPVVVPPEPPELPTFAPVAPMLACCYPGSHGLQLAVPGNALMLGNAADLAAVLAAGDTRLIVAYGAAAVDVLQGVWSRVGAVLVTVDSSPGITAQAADALARMDRLGLAHRPIVSYTTDLLRVPGVDLVMWQSYWQLLPTDGEFDGMLAEVAKDGDFALLCQWYDRSMPIWTEADLCRLQAMHYRAMMHPNCRAMFGFAFDRVGGLTSYPVLLRWAEALCAAAPAPTISDPPPAPVPTPTPAPPDPPVYIPPEPPPKPPDPPPVYIPPVTPPATKGWWQLFRWE